MNAKAIALPKRKKAKENARLFKDVLFFLCRQKEKLPKEKARSLLKISCFLRVVIANHPNSHARAWSNSGWLAHDHHLLLSLKTTKFSECCLFKLLCKF